MFAGDAIDNHANRKKFSPRSEHSLFSITFASPVLVILNAMTDERFFFTNPMNRRKKNFRNFSAVVGLSFERRTPCEINFEIVHTTKHQPIHISKRPAINFSCIINSRSFSHILSFDSASIVLNKLNGLSPYY